MCLEVAWDGHVQRGPMAGSIQKWTKWASCHNVQARGGGVFKLQHDQQYPWLSENSSTFKAGPAQPASGNTLDRPSWAWHALMAPEQIVVCRSPGPWLVTGRVTSLHWLQVTCWTKTGVHDSGGRFLFGDRSGVITAQQSAQQESSTATAGTEHSSHFCRTAVK